MSKKKALDLYRFAEDIVHIVSCPYAVSRETKIRWVVDRLVIFSGAVMEDLRPLTNRAKRMSNRRRK